MTPANKQTFSPPGYNPLTDAIELSAYNPNWPSLAQAEINRVRAILPKRQIIDIQHVGSTAIPDMIAKPIIDIQVAVHSLVKTKPLAIFALKTIGYEFWKDNPDSTRLFFVKGMPPYGAKRTHHVHIVESNSHHWINKLLFRDYLRAHPEAAKKYAELKQELAKDFQYDRERYTDSKQSFIHSILQQASIA